MNWKFSWRVLEIPKRRCVKCISLFYYLYLLNMWIKFILTISAIIKLILTTSAISSHSSVLYLYKSCVICIISIHCRFLIHSKCSNSNKQPISSNSINNSNSKISNTCSSNNNSSNRWLTTITMARLAPGPSSGLSLRHARSVAKFCPQRPATMFTWSYIRAINLTIVQRVMLLSVGNHTLR